jgi:hypothetical protein
VDINTYLTFAFWIGILAISLRSLTLMCAKYPRKEEYSVGFDVLQLLISIAVFVWVCLLKFN